MVVLEAEKLYHSGPMIHFSNLYDIVEFGLLVLYISALTLFHITLKMVKAGYSFKKKFSIICIDS